MKCDGWDDVQLADVVTFTSGGTPRKGEDSYWGGDIPWISGATLTELRLRSSERQLTARGVENGSRLAPRGATLILVRGMSLLEEIRIGQADRDLAFNQDVKALLASPAIDPWFLTYSLLGRRPELLGMVHQAGHGTGVLPTDRLRALRIDLPPLEEQRRIAGVLGALDDLIDANERLARELDQAFVTGWAAAGRRCDSQRAIGELVDLKKGVSYKGAFLADEGLPLINLGNFGVDGSFMESGIKHYLGAVPDRQRLSKGELVVANTDLTQRREILARPILVPYESATSTHHTFQVAVPGGRAQLAWIYGALRTETVRRRLISYATGTTVTALPADALLTQEIPRPEADDLERWWARASTLIEAQEALATESQEVARARDTLLPSLVSGRVRVGDAAA